MIYNESKLINLLNGIAVQKMYKIFVTVPESHTEKVMIAMAEADAGVIGNYTHCSFVSKGRGSSRPGDYARPYYGHRSKINYEPEDKIEMICNISDLDRVITAINDVHPYESPTIDVVEIQFYTRE